MSGYVPKGWTPVTSSVASSSAPYKPKGWVSTTDTPPDATPEPGIGDTIMDWFPQGALKGGLDEAAGEYLALSDMHRGHDPSTSMAEGEASMRKQLAAEAKAHPVAAGISRMAGDLTSDGLLQYMGVPVFTPVGQAGSGAVTGFLSADGDVPTRLGSAGVGAATGYGMGKLAKIIGPFKTALAGAGLQEGLAAWAGDETPEDATMRRVGELGGLAVSGIGALRGKAADLLGLGDRANRAESQVADKLNRGVENYQQAQTREYGKNESTALQGQADKADEFEAAVKQQGQTNLKAESLADKVINQTRLADAARAAVAKQAAGEDLSDVNKTAQALLGNDAKKAYAALRSLPSLGIGIDDPAALQGKRTLFPDFTEDGLNALRNFRDRDAPGDGKAARRAEIMAELLAKQKAQGEPAPDDLMQRARVSALPTSPARPDPEELLHGRTKILQDLFSPDNLAKKLGGAPEDAVPSGQRRDIADSLGYSPEAAVLPAAPPAVDPTRPRFMLGAQTPPTTPAPERMAAELDAARGRLPRYLAQSAGRVLFATPAKIVARIALGPVEAGTTPRGEFRDPAAAAVWNRALDRVVGGNRAQRERIGQFLAGQSGDALRARLTYLIGTIPGLRDAMGENSAPPPE